jgi:hypothetical protein
MSPRDESYKHIKLTISNGVAIGVAMLALKYRRL